MNIFLLVLLGMLALFVFSKMSGGGGNFQNINASKFAELMKDKNTVVLDVRTAGEIKGGKIKNAKEINVMSPAFSKKIEGLDKAKTYLVYCRSGNRSGQACSKMSNAGFENLYNLSGGYGAWLSR